MYQRGHTGITLLIGSGILVFWGPLYGIAATGLMLQVTMLPDIDQRLVDVRHRGPTHTIAFAFAVAIMTASAVAYPIELCHELLLQRWSLSVGTLPSLDIWMFVSVTLFLAQVGHILGDILTVGGGYKIRPLWPLSTRPVALGIWQSDSDVGNAALFACGCSTMVIVLVVEALLML